MSSPTPRPIGQAISAVLERLGLNRKIRQYEVLNCWPTVVGKRIASVATAERISDGKLFIHVTHAAWRNELTFLKKELITKLNDAMHETIVYDIIFK